MPLMDKTSLILRSSAHHLIIVRQPRGRQGLARSEEDRWKSLEIAPTTGDDRGSHNEAAQLRGFSEWASTPEPWEIGKRDRGDSRSGGDLVRRRATAESAGSSSAAASPSSGPARHRWRRLGNFQNRFFTCCLPDATPALLQHLLPRLPPWQLRDASPGRLRLCLSLVYTLLSLPSAPSCCSSAAPRTTENPAGLI